MKLTLSSENLNKSFGLPEGVDPTHHYVYRSGEHGIYEFWYKDRFNNYWQYTNAPEDHADYDPLSGEAMIVPDQPMPHNAPQFFTDENRKLHAAVPQEAELLKNEAYDALNPRSIWYAMYESRSGESRFLYYDTDVRENLDLWVQYQLRLVDAGLVTYRKYANQLFQSPHPKDRILGVILMLVDQGMFEGYELTQAKVEDVEYIDMTIKLLGKKIVCDPMLFDFFTTLTANRNPSEPLFLVDTNMGRRPIGVRHLYAIFKGLRISPHFLLYWHATHLFSRIAHRLAASGVPPEEYEDLAFSELARAFGTVEDISHMVDVQLLRTIRRNYAPGEEEGVDEEPPPAEGEEEEVSKAFTKVTQDDYGATVVYSDLVAKRPDEFEFSQWLHAMPLHDISDEEIDEISEQLAQEQEEAQQAEETPEEGDEGAVMEPSDDGEQQGAVATPRGRS